jgi:hypothetical protein
MDSNPTATRKVQSFAGWVTPKKGTRVLYRNQWPKRRIDWTTLIKRKNRIEVQTL